MVVSQAYSRVGSAVIRCIYLGTFPVGPVRNPTIYRVVITETLAVLGRARNGRNSCTPQISRFKTRVDRM